MRLCTVAILLLCSAPVSAQSITDGAAYLTRNEVQQTIVLRRQMDAQNALVVRCAPGTTAETFRPTFNGWLEDNPRLWNRPLQFALTAALTDLCP